MSETFAENHSTLNALTFYLFDFCLFLNAFVQCSEILLTHHLLDPNQVHGNEDLKFFQRNEILEVGITCHSPRQY